MDDPSQDNENLTVVNRNSAATENGNTVKSEMDTEIDEPHGGNGNAARSPVKSFRTRGSRSSEKKSNKRPIVYVLDCSGDEEEFAGFDMCSGITLFFSINRSF